MNKIWALWEVSVEGPGGTETLLFSNRPYKPVAGPNAGISYIASWVNPDVYKFAPPKNGTHSLQGGLRTTSGFCSFEPFSIVVGNRPTSLSSPTRELDHLFAPGDYVFVGDVTLRLAYGKVDGTAPDWADFGNPVFTGRIQDEPDLSKDSTTVTWHFKPNTSRTQTPLLTDRFTGMGGWFDTGSPGVKSTNPVGDLHAADWSVYFYANASLNAGKPACIYSAWSYVFTGPGDTEFPLVEIYRDTDNFLKLRFHYSVIIFSLSTLFDTYTIMSLAGLTYQDLRKVTVVWDDTNSTLRAYLDQTEIVNTPILNKVARSTSDDFYTLGYWLDPDPFPQAGDSDVRYSAMRVFDKALNPEELPDITGVIDYGDEDLIIPHLKASFEFNRLDGNLIINSVQGPDFKVGPSWGSSIDGEPSLESQVMPAVFGDVFNVELLEIDNRLGKSFVGVGASDVVHVYAQGVALQKDYSPGTKSYDFDGIRGTIQVTPGIDSDFGKYLADGQLITVGSGTFAGTYEIDDLAPSQYRRVRAAGSTDFGFKASVPTLAPTTVATESVSITTNPLEADWNDNETFVNPYGGPAGRLVTLKAPRPSPVTADVVGDAEILVSGAPTLPNYPAPGVIGNVFCQMIEKYGPKIDMTGFRPAYSDFPDRVGYVVEDESTTFDNVNELLRGCLLWADENGLGQYILKGWKFPEELSASHTLTEGSVVSVRRIERKGETSKCAVDRLIVDYNKSWTKLERSSIPEYAEPDNRDFMSSEWRSIPIGDLVSGSPETPRFRTYELRKSKARVIGNKALRIAQGNIYEVIYRYDGIGTMKDYEVQQRIDGDLPNFSRPNFQSILTGYTPNPFMGTIALNLWIGGP